MSNSRGGQGPLFPPYNDHDGSHSHMDAHIIYDLTLVHLLQCIFNLGPALLICYGPRSTLIRHCLTYICDSFLFRSGFRMVTPLPFRWRASRSHRIRGIDQRKLFNKSSKCLQMALSLLPYRLSTRTSALLLLTCVFAACCENTQAETF